MLTHTYWVSRRAAPLMPVTIIDGHVGDDSGSGGRELEEEVGHTQERKV
jgi:hypothetical protein